MGIKCTVETFTIQLKGVEDSREAVTVYCTQTVILLSLWPGLTSSPLNIQTRTPPDPAVFLHSCYVPMPPLPAPTESLSNTRSSQPASYFCPRVPFFQWHVAHPAHHLHSVNSNLSILSTLRCPRFTTIRHCISHTGCVQLALCTEKRSSHC